MGSKFIISPKHEICRAGYQFRSHDLIPIHKLSILFLIHSRLNENRFNTSATDISISDIYSIFCVVKSESRFSS